MWIFRGRCEIKNLAEEEEETTLFEAKKKVHVVYSTQRTGCSGRDGMRNGGNFKDCHSTKSPKIVYRPQIHCHTYMSTQSYALSALSITRRE